jgi:aminoacrylate hydrolase
MDSGAKRMRTIEQRAAEFEQTHASSNLANWRYYTAGHGDAVLLLPGGVGVGISWVDLALALRPDYRTVTVDYPPTAVTLAELADGILDIMDAEGIGSAHVVGQSAGGMLAAIRDTPWEQTLDAARTALRTAWQQSADGDFWIAQVEAAYHRLGRDGLANSYAMLLDLAQHSDKLRPGWDGPTLVLAAADDPLITPVHRQRLLDLHPGCALRVFPDGGHSLLLTRPTDYLA